MVYRPRTVLLSAGVSVAALVTSCTTGGGDPGSPPAASSSQVSPTSTGAPAQSLLGSEPQTVTTGLEAPWSVVFHDGVALVSERDSGRVLELAVDGTARVVGIVDGVVSAGEGGLLGLAADGKGGLYVYSTASDGNRIQRFDLTGTPGSLGLGAPRTLIDGIPAANTHDGGRIAFGPDGMLYATTGDAGQRDSAQDLDSLGGKILRMTPDGEVPEDNPFDGSFVYSYGHRNPQGLAWTDDGTLFATEFGQNTWDELNIITPGSNYGWPTVEGIADAEEFTDPVQQWEPGTASPSGMAYLDGTLFIANLRGEVLRTVPAADPGSSTDYYSGEYGRLRDVAPGPDGDLWVLTSNTDGRGDPTDEDDRILKLSPGAP